MPDLICPGCCGQLFLADPTMVTICPRCGTRTPAHRPASVLTRVGPTSIDFAALRPAIAEAARGLGTPEESAAIAGRLVEAAERLCSEAVHRRQGPPAD